MKKILLITYYWPPSGGPGVQRMLKFAKYLPDLGFQPLILTVKSGEYPAFDKTLFYDISPKCKVYRSFILEPNNIYKFLIGKQITHSIDHDVFSQKDRNFFDTFSKFIRLNFFIPDAKIGWIPFAVHKGKQILKQESPDIIMSSSPPPTVHLIAKRLARYSGIPWIADFRDPWTEIHYYNNKRTVITRRIDKHLEKSVIDSASHLTCVSKNFLQMLPLKKENTIIPNGFDEDDFKILTEVPDKFIITYMGSLNKNRFYREAFKKIKLFLDNNKKSSSAIELDFIGGVSEKVKKYLKKLFYEYKSIHFRGYLPHKEAVQKIKNSTILLLFLEKADDYRGHIPGKLFEYLATGNFILGIGEKGDAQSIIERTRTGKIISDPDLFYKILEDTFSGWKQGKPLHPDFQEINKYSRRKLTEKLVNVIDSLIGN
ncbi:MAG: glycosyltransferase [bacterium]